jgi:hypothetical protein
MMVMVMGVCGGGLHGLLLVRVSKNVSNVDKLALFVNRTYIC